MRSFRSALLGAALLLPLLATSCSEQHPTTLSPEVDRALATLGSDRSATTLAPNGTSGWAGFYPLAEGNWWRSLSGFTIRFIPNSGPAPPTDGEGWETLREVRCGASINGADYLVEVLSNVDVGTQSIPYRQDASGLHEAYVEIGTSLCDAVPSLRLRDGDEQAPRVFDRVWTRTAAAAPAGTDAAALEHSWRSARARLVALERSLGLARGQGTLTELLRLEYPLHPGQRWVVNSELGLEAEVIRRTQFLLVDGSTTPAYEVKFFAPYFGPQDDARMYWSRVGLLGYQFKLYGDWVDKGGAVLGRIEYTSQDMLMAWSIDGQEYPVALP